VRQILQHVIELQELELLLPVLTSLELTSVTMARALVFGATGLAGKYIIDAIVDSKSSFGKIGIFTSQNTVDTKPDIIKKLKDNGVEVHVGDLSQETEVVKAYKGRLCRWQGRRLRTLQSD
jgi:hypothetical protein